MKLKIITPVGPGHEKYLAECTKSVWLADKSAWVEVGHDVVYDLDGALGRSRARNSAIHGADWYFFLDADDVLMPDALNLCQFDYNATFGAVQVGGRVIRENAYPCYNLARVVGTLSMGFFYRDTGLRFNEDLDVGEDFDFYNRLTNWIKIKPPLVNIRKGLTSAGGPRGNTRNDWVEICKRIVRPDKYN